MYKETIPFINHGAQLIAHRGLSGLRMENTIPAFRLAGEHPFFGIETDVHRTRDGKFIIIHDDDTLRVTGQKKVVEETGFATLRSMKVLDNFGLNPEGFLMPTLQDYLHVCSETEKNCVLEIKNHMEAEDLENIIGCVMEHGMLEKTIFISFDLPNLVQLRMRLPEQPMQLLVGEEDCGNLISQLSTYQLDLDIYYQYLTEKRLNQLHNAGVKVNVWVVDDPDVAEKLSAWGVDFITTDILVSKKE